MKIIKVSEFDLEYEVLGSGTNIILLEAGMTRDLSDWDLVISDISIMAKVIRYSIAGNGNSSPTKQHFSAQQYVNQTK